MNIPVLQDKLTDLKLVLDESIENVVELQDCTASEPGEQRETLQLLGEVIASLSSVSYSALVLLMIGYLFFSNTENIIVTFLQEQLQKWKLARCLSSCK